MERSPRLHVQMPKYIITIKISANPFWPYTKNALLRYSPKYYFMCFDNPSAVFVHHIYPTFLYRPPFFPVLLYIYTKTSRTPNMQHLNGFSFISFHWYYLWHIYLFFTLYTFMSHHPSQHSYLDYFAFLGLYSISSPISQSALNVNTIFNTPWFRSLVGRKYSVEKILLLSDVRL